MLTKYFCDYCDFEGYSGNYLMKHRREDNPGINLYGNVCCKEFNTNDSFKVYRLAIYDEYKVQ